jgi:hypothetical protein
MAISDLIALGLDYQLTGCANLRSLFFCPMADEYAFGEMDEIGKRNLAAFAAEATPGCLFEFMPVEGGVYFIRKANQHPEPSG